MNYFDLNSIYPEQTIAAAWDSQVAEIIRTPRLAEVFEKSGSEIFPRFAACYRELRALPRSARRSLQRRIACSGELVALLPEYFKQGGRRLQHRMAWSLAGAALLLALGQGIVEAATITVTTTNPRIKRDGNCSLKEAIVNANKDANRHKDCPAGSGADTIVLPANADITLKGVHNNRHGPTGLPRITSPITIQGNGATIVRSQTKKTPRFRLIAVGNTGDLTLQDVTLSGGSSKNHGGGVLNHGTLFIQNSTISGNSARFHGGGVHNLGALTTQSSAVSGNEARYGGGGVGNLSSGSVSIENSTISDNSADSAGGGIFNFNSYASVSIENSVISGNHAVGAGGGIFNYGTVNVADSTISDNSASSGGGAFNTWSYFSPNTLNITNSTISGNEASDDGGGIFNYRSGCYYGSCYFGGYLSLVDSTITQNVAGNSGGGLFNEGTLSMTNSTISNNQAPVGPDIFP